MQDIVNALWNEIFPSKCVFCKKSSPNFICSIHKKALKILPESYAFDETMVYSVADYRNPITKRLVFLYKFWGIFKISDFIAKQILEEFSELIPKNSWLVPIPLHWTRFIWRGYNQAEKIAKSLQKIRPDLQICTQLKRLKKTKQQALLSKKERENNMTGVFGGKNIKIPKNSSIFLIDDVFTSGSTVRAAKKTLKEKKIQKINIICFARTRD